MSSISAFNSLNRPRPATLCIQTSTASGVPGRQYLPGHAGLAVYRENPQAMRTEFTTLAQWPAQPSTGSKTMDALLGFADNFASSGQPTAVRVNDPNDHPSLYPFRYCQTVTDEGLADLARFARGAGEYNVQGNNCVTFASRGFELATRQSIFGTPAEPGGVHSPRLLGAGIERANANPLGAGPGWGTTLAESIAHKTAGLRSAVGGFVDRVSDAGGRFFSAFSSRVVDTPASYAQARAADGSTLYRELSLGASRGTIVNGAGDGITGGFVGPRLEQTLGGYQAGLIEAKAGLQTTVAGGQTTVTAGSGAGLDFFVSSRPVPFEGGVRSGFKTPLAGVMFENRKDGMNCVEVSGPLRIGSAELCVSDTTARNSGSWLSSGLSSIGSSISSGVSSLWGGIKSIFS